MNREQAIEQIEIKLKDMEMCVGLVKRGNEFIPEQSTPLMDSLRMALAALRNQQDRENPKPLTLDELKERVEGADFVHGWIRDGSVAVPAVIDKLEGRIVGIWCATQEEWFYEKDYGTRWIFFDHQPTV